MSQDILINKLLYSKDPFENLNTVRPYYDSWYDNAIVIDTKAAKKYQERIPYHLKDLVVGYVRNNLTTLFLPVLGRVNMIDEAIIGIMPIKVLSREVNDISLDKSIELVNKKVHPIVLTPSLLLGLGFNKYKVNGFSGYRIKVNGSYVKVKFDSYRDGVVSHTIRLGTNVFRGTYLHQLMEILNLYFGL